MDAKKIYPCPLISAIVNDDLISAVQLLRQCFVSSNPKGPLHYAIKNGRDSLVAILCEQGYPCSARSLLLAMKLSLLQIVRTLLAYDAEIDLEVEIFLFHHSYLRDLTKEIVAKRNSSLMPTWQRQLFTAIALNRQKEVRSLYFAGSDLQSPDNQGTTPLMVAIQFRHGKLATSLIPFSSLNSQNKQGLTGLMLAVENNLPKVVRNLLGAGASREIRSRSGNTALRLAELINDERMIELLS